MSIMPVVLERMQACFNADAAAEMDHVFQFFIPDAGNYFLRVSGGKCSLEQGDYDEPSVSLTMDLDVLMSILNGNFNGVQAFMFGKVKVSGDMRLATQLSKLFSAGS